MFVVTICSLPESSIMTIVPGMCSGPTLRKCKCVSISRLVDNRKRPELYRILRNSRKVVSARRMSSGAGFNDGSERSGCSISQRIRLCRASGSPVPQLLVLPLQSMWLNQSPIVAVRVHIFRAQEIVCTHEKRNAFRESDDAHGKNLTPGSDLYAVAKEDLS